MQASTTMASGGSTRRPERAVHDLCMTYYWAATRLSSHPTFYRICMSHLAHRHYSVNHVGGPLLAMRVMWKMCQPSQRSGRHANLFLLTEV